MNAEAEAKVKAKVRAKASDEMCAESGGIAGSSIPIMTLLPKTMVDFIGEVEVEGEGQWEGQGQGGADGRWKEKRERKRKGQRKGGFLSPAPKEKSLLGTLISVPDEGEQNPGSDAGSRSRDSPRAGPAAHSDVSPTRPSARGVGAGGGSPRHKLGRALVPATAIPEAWRGRSVGEPGGVPEGVPGSATAVDRRIFAVYDLEHRRATQQRRERDEEEKSTGQRREAGVDTEANGAGEMPEEEASRALYPGVAMAFARIGVDLREGPAVSAVVGGVGRYAAGGA